MVFNESQALGRNSRLNSRRMSASTISQTRDIKAAVHGVSRFLWVTCTFIYTFRLWACQVSRNHMCPEF